MSLEEHYESLAKKAAREIVDQRDLITDRFILANVTRERGEAVLQLLKWLDDADNKEDFLLYINAIDLNAIFSTKFMNIVLKLHDLDPVKIKALEYGLIRSKK